MITLEQINSPIQSNAGEFWKYVPNTNQRYLISNQGRLLTTKHKNSNRHAIMKPAKNPKGYLATRILKEGKLKSVTLHRLVASAWIENPQNKTQVNHINFLRSDNRVENLEWCTPAENTQYSYDAGRIKKPICTNFVKGSKIGTSKLNEQQVKEIRAKFKPYQYTRKMLAAEYGVADSTIKDVILRRWKHVQ